MRLDTETEPNPILPERPEVPSEVVKKLLVEFLCCSGPPPMGEEGQMISQTLPVVRFPLILSLST